MSDVDASRASANFLTWIPSAHGHRDPTTWRVDSEVLLRTILSGHTVVYEPHAVASHVHRPEYAALRRQVYAYGAGLSVYDLKTLLAHPVLILDFVRKLPASLRFALSPRSSYNAKKLVGYPPELTRLEDRGILYGPLGYTRSRRKQGPHPVPRARLQRGN
jgi:hypothetical protein